MSSSEHNNEGRAMAVFTLIVAFIFTCSSTEGTVCPPNLKNLAVYRGDKDVLIEAAVDPNITTWFIYPASDDTNEYTITDNDGMINPTYRGLFYLNQSGLVVLNATTTAYGGPIPTCGLYGAECNDDSVVAKFLVVLHPPECSSNDSSAGDVRLSCAISYCDDPMNRIRANMTWKVGGVFHSTEIPKSQASDGGDGSNVWVSTSTITVNNSVAADYECIVIFNPPIMSIPTGTQRNAPAFRASCSNSGGVTTKQVETTTPTLPSTTTTTLLSTTPASTSSKCSCIRDFPLIIFKLSCSVKFTDSTITQNHARVIWRIDGVYYTTDTSPMIQKSQYVSTATSTIKVISVFGFWYGCRLTFAEPSNISSSDAPDSSQSCSGFCPFL